MPKHGSNSVINTLMIVFVVFFCVVFMANSWLSSEMKESQAEVNPVVTQTVRSNKVKPTNLMNQGELGSSQSNEGSSMSTSGVPKKKRRKIIYEIPLDDVNLVQ